MTEDEREELVLRTFSPKFILDDLLQWISHDERKSFFEDMIRWYDLEDEEETEE